jgi:hypothetical protein
MKTVFKITTNIKELENLVRTMSKGYYSNFNEYNPDHLEPDDSNDHSQIIEENDLSIPGRKKNNDTE